MLTTRTHFNIHRSPVAAAVAAVLAGVPAANLRAQETSALTLEEIASGVEKKIRVKHLKRCATCEAKGGQGGQVCPQCQGRGQVRRGQQTMFAEQRHELIDGRDEADEINEREPALEQPL
mgnify:CR=1 FL=1